MRKRKTDKQRNGATLLPPDCHPDRIQYAKHQCRSCYNKERMDARPDLRERARLAEAARKKVRIGPPPPKKFDVENRRTYMRRYSREYRLTHLAQYRRTIEDWRLRTNYGLTRAQYDALLIGQSGRCAICSEALRRSPHTDHDHATGRIRGLLCISCNALLGFARERVDVLGAAIAYLSVAA